MPQDSVSFQTLEAAKKHVFPSKLSIKTFLFDNTPDERCVGTLSGGALYESKNKNLGLADAYNHALKIAEEGGYEWLLTLDQDTTLPVDFLEKLYDALAYVTTFDQVAAVVPRICDKGRVVSPNALSHNLFPKFFPTEFVGISLEKTSAINSAATIKVSALRSIGGYDRRFWLDYSDAIMFYRLHLAGKRIFIAGNIQVEHELSVLDMKDRVSLKRYGDILAAESAYWDECMSGTANVALLLRYAYRIFYKFWRTKASLPYFKICLSYFWRRILISRKQRLREWNRSAERRLDEQVKGV